MSPVTHYLSSWLVANAAASEPGSRRDRVLVTVAGIIPDADGFGFPVEALTKGTEHELLWFSDYHHVLGHNIGFCLLVTAVAFIAAKRRVKTALVAFGAFHLHLLCDVIGARGPDGYQWPVPYLEPFSDAWQLVWSGQWALNAWPNVLVTALALGTTFYLAWRRGFSPIEMISRRADAGFVAALRRRIPRAAQALAPRAETDGGEREAGSDGQSSE